MIFVTGATGLVGSHILVELAKENKSVLALKRRSSNINEVKQIFQHYFNDAWEENYQKVQWVDGDLQDTHLLGDILKEAREVIHTAALVSFKPNDRNRLYKTNVEGTFNLVNACLNANTTKLCHISSTAAIGRTKNDKILSEKNVWKTSPDNSYYAVTKNTAELEVWRGIEEGLNAVIVNPCVILGPADWSKGSSAMFKRTAKGVKFYTKGENAFVDVRDVARISLELLQSNISKERFLTVSENLPYKAVFDKILSAYKLPLTKWKATPLMTEIAWRADFIRSVFGGESILTKETARSSQKVNHYSNKKIKNTLNWEFISVDDAIKNTVAYHKKFNL